MKKYNNRLTIIWISIAALATVILCGWIINQSIRSHRAFVLQHNETSMDSVSGMSSQLKTIVKELQRSVEIFTHTHTDLLEKLSAEPGNEGVISHLEKDLRFHFPEFVSFTVADKHGELLIDDMGETIGELCLRDIREFSTADGYSMVLHPGPSEAHIDVMVRWGTPGGVNGVFFLGISPQVLVGPLRNIQAPNHNLYVLRMGDRQGLIEVGAEGHRLQLVRDSFLSQEELSQINATENIDNTQWQVVDFPDIKIIDEHYERTVSRAVISISAIIALAIFMGLLILREYRARQRYENQLLIAKEIAERASYFKSEFLSSMSHELRTPLNAIMGFSQLLEQSLENDQDKKDASEIYKAGEHLLKLINQVLDLASIEAGKIKLHNKPVKIRPVIDTSVTLIEGMAGMQRIRILQQHDIDDEVCVHADELRLKQVLLNLLSNAIKYNKEDGIVTIKTEIITGNFVRLTVSDTGKGLADGQRKLIFKPFERAGLEGRSKIQGTGIGLVITKQLVEMMGGHIGFSSELGKGSSFWVELPALLDSQVSTDFSDDTESTKNEKLLGRSAEYQLNIVYVEDDIQNQNVLRRMLNEFTQCQLIIADNAQDGFVQIQSSKPDIVLIDIDLPGELDGIGLLKKLRSGQETNHIPAVAISASASKADIDRGMQAGFDDYMTKPVHVERLLATLRKLSN